MTKRDKSNFKPWIVLAAAIGINLTMGVNYSWSIISKALVTSWHWNNVQASIPYTVYTPCLALSMFLAGRLQDKYGPRIIANLGCLFVSTGLISCGFVHTPLLMVITYGLAGIGNGLCYSTTSPTCLKWFPPEKRGIISGAVASSVALAAAYFSPVFNWLLKCYGISNSFRIVGIAVFIVLVFATQLLSNPPGNHPIKTSSNQAIKIAKKYSANKDIDWHEMIKARVFYKLWFIFFLAASAGLMIMAHIATIASKQAHWENGFYLVMLFAIFNTAGRIIAGYLSDKYNFLNIMKIVFVLQAVNLVAFSSYNSPLLLVLGTMLMGFCYGSVFSLIAYGIVNYYGVKNFGGNYGLVYTAWGFAGFIGPLLAGRVVDLTGKYYIAYLISAVFLIITILLASSIKSQVEKSGHFQQDLIMKNNKKVLHQK